MRNNIVFQPLISTQTGVYCHLLTINCTNILINCGGDSKHYSSNILKIINKCDCILITSFDYECIGGLFFLLNQGFYKPVYMSVPIKEFSMIFQEKEFENIYEIKFLQTFNVNDVQICAYNSGNSLGASLFKITSNLENIYIGYNINHRKENHLNGIDFKKITDSFVFITNSKYCYKENINVNIRNDQFLTLVKNVLSNKSKKMVIYVTYPRFHELGMILNAIKGKKIVVLDKYIDKFINKSKNMVEWSNSKLIEENDVYEYPNIERVSYYSKMTKFDICVILNEDITLLDKYNNENLCVVFIDKMFDFSNKPVYSYKGNYQVINEVTKEDLISESSDEDVEVHWSEQMFEIRFNTDGILICDGLQNTNDKINDNFEDMYKEIYDSTTSLSNETRKIYKIDKKLNFDQDKKTRNFDNYGEYVDQDKFVVKVEKILVNEEQTIEEVYIETKEVIKVGIEPKFKSVIFNLQGISDLKNIKVILQNIESKKIILVDDDPFTSRFMYNNLLCSVNDVQVCQSPINLSSNRNINIVNVSDVINNMRNQEVTLDDTKIYRFIGKKENDNIKCIKTPSKISTCNFSELKKKLMGVNLKIERVGESFLIQDKVYVKFDNDQIVLDGEESDVYFYIRVFLMIIFYAYK